MVESQKNISKNMGNHICLVQSQKDSDYCKLAKAIDIIIYCGLSLSARIVYYQIVVKDVQKRKPWHIAAGNVNWCSQYGQSEKLSCCNRSGSVQN